MYKSINALTEQETEKINEVMADVRVPYGINPDYIFICHYDGLITFDRILKIHAIKPIKFIRVFESSIFLCFGGQYPLLTQPDYDSDAYLCDCINPRINID